METKYELMERAERGMANDYRPSLLRACGHPLQFDRNGEIPCVVCAVEVCVGCGYKGIYEYREGRPWCKSCLDEQEV